MNLVSNTLLSIQLIGDYFVCMGQIFLLQSINRNKSCTSVSIRTQILLAIIFTIRYTDLAIAYVKAYKTSDNEFMVALYTVMYNFVKIVHIFISYWTLLIVFMFFRRKESRKFDTFRSDVLIWCSAALALLVNLKFEAAELLWRFTFYLEAVAILPQAHLASKAKYTENIILYYVGLLGLYKIAQMVNWIVTYHMGYQFDQIAFAAGLVQLIFYGDFIINNISLSKSKNNLSKINIEEGGKNSRCSNNEQSQPSSTRQGPIACIITPTSL